MTPNIAPNDSTNSGVVPALWGDFAGPGAPVLDKVGGYFGLLGNSGGRHRQTQLRCRSGLVGGRHCGRRVRRVMLIGVPPPSLRPAAVYRLVWALVSKGAQSTSEEIIVAFAGQPV